MAAPKKATHVVNHRRLYLAVGGQLQHVPAGTEVAMSNEQAKRLGGKVAKIGEQKAVDLTADKADG